MAAEAMKVGVLTFHTCINYGSYWQARCLVEGLRALGHDAELLDHDSPSIRHAEWRCAFRPLLPEHTARADLPRYGRKTRGFLEAFDRLPRSLRFSLDRPEEAPPYDAIVVGSDEVWNFRHPWYGYKPIFFGEGLRTRRLISYAASFGNHDAANGIEPDWAAKLNRFDFISVRDDNSRRLVEESLHREPAVVLDPCLMFPPAPVHPEPASSRYVALYGHSFPVWFITAIRRWAMKRACRIVSIGYRTEWADEQRIEAGPHEFSALIAGAEAVATNFFHGCVFALHHKRPFACAASAYRLNKIGDLTRSLSAERHMVSETTTADVYDALLGTPIDPVVDTRIEAMRWQSRDYLEAALG